MINNYPLMKRIFFATVFWLLQRCALCDTSQANRECPVLTATLDNCETTFLFVWNENGTLWNGGMNIITFSGCYDKNECYLVEAGYTKQGCKLQVEMDGVVVLKKTLSSESDTHWFQKSLYFLGKCGVRCPGETTLLLTNSSPLAVKDFEFTLHTFNTSYIEGVLRHYEMVTFCVNLEKCSLLDGHGRARHYLLQGNNLIDKEGEGEKRDDMHTSSKSIMIGNCMKSCTDMKIILSITPGQTYSYTLKEEDNLLDKSILVQGNDKEFCLDSRKCYQFNGNGKSTYVHIEDGNVISYERNVNHLLIGSCKKLCERKPLLSSTRRSVDIFSVISSVSTSEDLIDIHNKKYEAICWLIFDDTKHLEVTDPFLIQRYVLALFYLSTNGNNWYNSFGYMSASNECNWGGVACLDGFVTELEFSK